MRLNQFYIKSDGNHILCISKLDDMILEKKGVIVLVPGFSQSKSDIDYFMSRLGNNLVRMGYIVVQIDLYGHGDSYGDLSTISWNKIICNLKDIYFYLQEHFNRLPIKLCTRSIYGNVVLTSDLRDLYERVICLNPVLGLSEIQCFDNLPEKATDLTWLTDDIEIAHILETMGCELSNIRAQLVNTDFLDGLKNLEVDFAINEGKYVFTYEINNGKVSFEEQSRLNFIRDVVWQEDVICMLSEIIGNE